jgi:hypothetical protein
MEKPSEKTYTINGQHKAMTDDEFDKFCQDLAVSHGESSDYIGNLEKQDKIISENK